MGLDDDYGFMLEVSIVTLSVDLLIEMISVL